MGGKLSVDIDPKKLNRWMDENGFSASYVSSVLGRSPAYIATTLRTGKMSLSTFRLMKKEFGLNDCDLSPDKNEDKTQCVGYSVDLQVRPDRVKFTLLHSGSEIYSAFAKVMGEKESDLIKAISYAAHMCYKFAEQKDIGSRS